jgi:hypothetical protein
VLMQQGSTNGSRSLGGSATTNECQS